MTLPAPLPPRRAKPIRQQESGGHAWSVSAKLAGSAAAIALIGGITGTYCYFSDTAGNPGQVSARWSPDPRGTEGLAAGWNRKPAVPAAGTGQTGPGNRGTPAQSSDKADRPSSTMGPLPQPAQIDGAGKTPPAGNRGASPPPSSGASGWSGTSGTSAVQTLVATVAHPATTGHPAETSRASLCLPVLQDNPMLADPASTIAIQPVALTNTPFRLPVDTQNPSAVPWSCGNRITDNGNTGSIPVFQPDTWPALRQVTPGGRQTGPVGNHPSEVQVIPG
jgi:predicted ribosomally synthesized peptide with SipW-like signal peptide